MAMTEMLTLILVNSFLLLASCSNEKIEESINKNEIESKETEIDKKRIGNLLEDTVTSSILKTYYPEEYDQEIVGICTLFNSKSLNGNLFANYESKLYQTDELFIINGESYCRLHIANGGNKDEFQSASIGFIEDLPISLKYHGVLYEGKFKTNNGIFLGMALVDFYKSMSPKNKFIKTTKNESVELTLSDSYNVYQANYKFKSNKLIEISFGYSED